MTDRLIRIRAYVPAKTPTFVEVFWFTIAAAITGLALAWVVTR
jgi:hypothetical protein